MCERVRNCRVDCLPLCALLWAARILYGTHVRYACGHVALGAQTAAANRLPTLWSASLRKLSAHTRTHRVLFMVRPCGACVRVCVHAYGVGGGVRALFALHYGIIFARIGIMHNRGRGARWRDNSDLLRSVCVCRPPLQLACVRRRSRPRQREWLTIKRN